MKDNCSSSSKMINRNWVMKRKRRKLPVGPDLANRKEDNSVALESPRYTSSAAPVKRRLKTDITAERSSSKKKGHDGYYYECVICDVGGDLLCCDSCPRTYHIECLNPPLKRIPMGKWLCPKCSQHNDALKPINRLDSIAKRARTKTVKKTSQAGSKSSGVERASQIFGRSIISGEQSSGKGKSVLTEESKSSEKEVDPSSMDGGSAAEPGCISIDGQSDSSCRKEDDLRKPNTASVDPPPETRSSVPADEDLSESKLTNLELNDEASKVKLESDCNEVAENKKAIGVGDAKGRGKKRKHECYNGGKLKKCKTDKGKAPAGICKKSLSKAGAVNTKTSKSSKKKKRISHVAFKSLSKDESSMEKQRKTEKLPKEESRASRDSDKPSSYVDDIHCLPVGHLQVDRVLGCRIQGQHKIASHGTLLNDLYPDTLRGGEDWDRHPEESSMRDTNADIGIAEDRADLFPETGKGSDDEACSKNANCADKIHVYKRSVAKECKRSNMVNLLKVENKDSPVKDKDIDDSAVVTNGSGEKDEKILMEENADITLNEENEELKFSGRPVSDGVEILKEAQRDLRENGSVAKDKVEEPVAAKTLCPNGETISYDFLVKWVGISHIHNSWISESDLKVLAKRKLENYKSKYGTAVLNICEDKWKQPQRVIALRGSKEDKCEAYVKWTGLAYDECTWESLEEPVLRKSSHLIDLYEQFEQNTLEKEAAKDCSPRGRCEGQQSEIVMLTEQPAELKGGSLFPHQLEALNWLRKCWHKSKNVILADEMGLGKTVSACAFLSSLYFEFKVSRPCLVLVPLSTMPNWLSEFSLWAPFLNVVEYHGGAKARAIIREYEWHANDPNVADKRTTSYKFDVLLTTYEMVLADSSHLRGVPWEVLLVDEGHRLKNSESKLFSLLNTFSFQHRVLLTGTPLQNNIGEMYNLLNFLQPSSFPSLSSFEEKFHDLTAPQKVEELKKLVAPHMLRRLKKDAMQNIPPKTERMVPVELTSIQAEYYRAMLTKNYQILRNIGKGVAQQSMLNIVMQLRKVCNHPYLIPGTEPESGSMEFLHEMRIKASAKLTLLHSMLKVLRKEGHRVLIFSQMTKLLDILEDYLNVEFGPKTFERVDGSVSVADRQAAIARFNQDKSRFVFLLSTRSCGLGINLATADTVIIYDSDFNPHADIQAMNRAHRIGQSNRLLVYRLVVRASVEERILQLAKKKLMLDQLFVNKSGSQKEVEDILRWGTEELFNDSPGERRKDTCESNGGIGEVVLDLEYKSRKKGGGLGDVYQDKCTDGNGKIVWDENAVMKLLDRSSLQSGSCDGADTDFENDMLGSVKPVEWSEEAAEEQGGVESPAPGVDDTAAQSLENKEDNAGSATEENEWDKLLRVRWEKYQSEEEAALGRGKRLRKAVSYREAYAPHPIEALSESGGEDDKEPEPEPKKEYTPAGRALKEKFAKLRARQKKRLAERNSVEESLPNGPLNGPECHPNCRDADQATEVSEQIKEAPLVIHLEDSKATQQLDSLKGNADSTLSLGSLTKHKIGSSSDLASDLPNQHCQGSRRSPSFPPSSLLPVLGLCAPNLNPSEFSRRNSSRSSDRQSRPITGPEFPFSLPPTTSGQSLSLEGEAKERDPVFGKLKSQDTQEEAPHQAPRNNNNLDSWLPLRPFPPVAPPGDPDRPQSSGPTFSDFRERFPLPNLPFDEKLLTRFPFPPRSMGTSHQDFLPNLALGNRFEGGGLDNSMKDLLAMPPMPFLPNLKIPPLDPPAYNQQEKELPPFGLDQLPSTFSSIPENHRKVLENIMLRTGSGVSQFNKKRTRVDAWSEDELDSLWVGVRRHGHGNWESILRDPRLKFSKFKTPEYLAARWEEEQRKFLDGLSQPSKRSKAAKSARSSLFPGIPEGMMNRALHGAKFVMPPRFQSHLTDMKLGFSDLASTLPLFEPSDHLGLRSQLFPSTTPCPDNLPGDSSAGPSERPCSSLNIPSSEKPFPLNSLGMGNVGTLVLNSLSTLNAQRKEEERNAIKRGKLPCFFNRPLPPVLDSGNNNFAGRSMSPGLVPGLLHPQGKDAIGSSSSENKLPHWLRDAVSAPVARSHEPDLPPSVSAIAQSVRLLYGEESTSIPPFVIPEPPPPIPRDPRHNLRKKKKRRSHLSIQMPVDVQIGSQGNDPLLHSSIPLDQLSLSVAGTSGLCNSNLPPLSLNSEEPCSSANRFRPMNTSKGLSPSPEVLQLAVSCAAPGPSFQGITTGVTRLSSPDSKTSNPESTHGVGDSELKSGAEKTEPDQPCHSGKLPEEKQEEQSSEDDSKKSQPEPTMAVRLDVDEEGRPKADEVVSSEGTVSDNAPSDH